MPTSLFRGRAAPALLALAAALGCSEGTAPAPPQSGAPDFAGQAFRLTIDTRTGRVTVAKPGTAGAGSGGPSFSLIGQEAVRVDASSCTFGTIPNNSKQKRCTLSLTLGNRLEFTDLVTPTTFPRPPQGTTGLLVFAYTAAALGVPGGGATPNSEWDRSPINFFNDFGGCVGGKASDCYRWELFTSPLYAGTTGETRTVGFDVDKAAHEVSAYIVVAADLRDNPHQTLTIGPEANTCGRVFDFNPGTGKTSTTANLQVGHFENGSGRGFCGFELAGLPAGASILSAILRLTQTSGSQDVEALGPVLVDHLNYGTLDDDDFDLAPLTANIGSLPATLSTGVRTVAVDAAVKADLAAGRPHSQFRLRLTTESGDLQGDVVYGGTENDHPPELVITYRKR